MAESNSPDQLPDAPPETTNRTEEEDNNNDNFLLTYMKDGPIAPLNQYYQQKLSNSIALKNCLKYSVCTLQNETKWWRSVFTCPISDKEYHSGLTLELLQEASIGKVPSMSQHQLELHRDFFGKRGHDYVIDDDYVYFKTKKMAHKTSALCALEGLALESKMIQHRSVFRSVKTEVVDSLYRDDELEVANETTGPVGDEEKEEFSDEIGRGNSLEEIEVGTKLKSGGNYPKWVHKLYDIGVVSSCFSVEFKEFLPPKEDTENYLMLSKIHPTQLCCVLSLLSPLKTQVISGPHQSKHDAMSDAVTLVLDKLKSELSNAELSIYIENQMIKFKDRELAEKEAILKRWQIANTSRFVFPLPSFATEKIIIPTQHDMPACTLYLYEVEFRRECGNFLLPRGENLYSRIGLLCGHDIHTVQRIDANNDVQISCTLALGGESKVLVHLTNRTIVNFTVENAKDLDMAKDFNAILDRSKQYGIGLECRKVDGRPIRPYSDSNSNEEDFCSELTSDRTYMFVPIKMEATESGGIGVDGEGHVTRIQSQVLGVNWSLIKNVVNNNTRPCIRSKDEGWWKVPYSCQLSSTEVTILSVLVCIAAIAPSLYCRLRGGCYVELSISEVVISLSSALLSLVAFIVDNAAPERVVCNSELQNRFLYQVNSPKCLYVPVDEECQVSTQSDFPSDEFTTFEDYYLKRYGIQLRHRKQTLIPVHAINNVQHDTYVATFPSQEQLSSPNTLQVEDRENASDHNEDNLAHIVPELVRVFPLPRDFMYIYRLTRGVIMQLERVTMLHNLFHRMEQLKEENRLHTNQTLSLAFSQPSILASTDLPIQQAAMSCNEMENYEFTLWKCAKGNSKMISLLEEATTLYPCVAYERLEHLGDRVLDYFVAINLFSRNKKLQWDSDELGDFKSLAVRNQVLYNAALRIGLSRIVWKGAKKWSSAYKYLSYGEKSPIADMHSNLDYSDTIFSTEISDGQLSDVLESLLAVAFMDCSYDIENKIEDINMVLALLNEIALPLPKCEDYSEDRNPNWFQAPSACLLEGYLFRLDENWKTELLRIGTLLESERNVFDQLNNGRDGFISLLERHGASSQCLSLLNSHESQIMLLCALFDDSLESKSFEECDRLSYDSSKIEEEESYDEVEGLMRAACFRDNLYFVGDSALHLCICTQSFINFPNATPGDLHLLRACAISDDVLVYVFLKNGFHEFLYDKDSSSIPKFLSKAEVADSRGRKRWGKRGGWILDGGIEEFRRRWQTHHMGCSSELRNQSIGPQYVGLSGGCLYGEKEKISFELTEEISFSFKAIVGALVLSVGLDHMWRFISPFFIEIMLLSPDELRREFNGISNICSNYSKGRSISNAITLQSVHGIGWSANQFHT